MIIIIISGPSGSGKTTLSNLIKEKLENAFITRTDNYYKTGLFSKILPYFIKSYFDRQISLDKRLLKNDIKDIIKNKKAFHFYKYDFIDRSKVKVIKYTPKIDYLIIEGIFSLEIINLISDLDYILLNLKTTKKECKKRIFQRDINERGKNKKNLLMNFSLAWKLYKNNEKKFPSKSFKKVFILKEKSDINKCLDFLSKGD
tara:strand:+ start:329 stop:931 length:603 start_codon:yes stop_codon:yes gene_type:complete